MYVDFDDKTNLFFIVTSFLLNAFKPKDCRRASRDQQLLYNLLGALKLLLIAGNIKKKLEPNLKVETGSHEGFHSDKDCPQSVARSTPHPKSGRAPKNAKERNITNPSFTVSSPSPVGT